MNLYKFLGKYSNTSDMNGDTRDSLNEISKIHSMYKVICTIYMYDIKMSLFSSSGTNIRTK